MVVIRSFQTDDESEIHEIDAFIQREYRGEAWERMTLVEKQQFLWYPDPLPPEAMNDFLLVATEGKDIVGFLFAARDALAPRNLTSDGVAVLPEYRRQQVASARL